MELWEFYSIMFRYLVAWSQDSLFVKVVLKFYASYFRKMRIALLFETLFENTLYYETGINLQFMM